MSDQDQPVGMIWEAFAEQIFPDGMPSGEHHYFLKLAFSSGVAAMLGGHLYSEQLPPEKRAAWIALIRADMVRVRAELAAEQEELIRQHPDSPPAEPPTN